jgi:streptogramin lyase
MRRQKIIAGLIQRFVSSAALSAFLFSAAGGAFAQAPQLTKQFGATIIPVHGSTSLTFTVINTLNSFMLTGVGFTDTLPAGLVISTPNGLVNTCGGTIAAAAGGNNIGLSGGSAQANSTCSLIVNVTATGIGTITNTTSAITSSGGTGTPATASLNVEPIISEYPIPTADSGLVYITAGPDGALWFTENSANNIGRITSAGVITEYPLPIAQSAPIGIVAGPDGALWFTELLGNRIGRITTSGFITAEYFIPTASRNNS